MAVVLEKLHAGSFSLVLLALLRACQVLFVKVKTIYMGYKES